MLDQSQMNQIAAAWSQSGDMAGGRDGELEAPVTACRVNGASRPTGDGRRGV